MKLLFILGTLLCLVRADDDNKATLKSLVVTSDIKVRYASTVVSAEYFNDKNSAVTADFHVVLPDRAYISNFSMEMDGNVSVGEVKAKAEAKRLYEDAVNRGESAGYVSVRHRNTKQFDMAVNIEPNVKVVFNLTYEELLKRTEGNYSHQIFLLNDEVIDRMLVEVFISEPQDIKVLEENIHEDISVRSVDYIDNNHVYIRFDPSREEQQKLIDAGYIGEFTIEYDVDRNNSNVIYTLDGYFIHFFAPDDEPVWPKNIVFMIDVSGSMKGRKIRQVKAAMRKILASLNPHKDTFTFGTFSRNVTWQHSDSLEKAEKFITSLRARGGTNINEAMLASLEKLEKENPSKSANILFFLTDGDPTVGVIDNEVIRQNIKAANKRNVMIFTLGFGEDCDHEFLKKIAADNNGFSRKIYIDEDSDSQIKDMFNEISSLLLKDIIITYVDSSIDVGKITKNEFKTFFKGSEIAIAGPIKQGKERPKSITIEIKGQNAQTTFVRRQELDISDFDFDVIDLTLDDIPNNPNLTKLHQLQDITKKTWAYLSLKKMFEENAPREDIVDMAVEYGFVTEVTSMVVTKEHLRGKEFKEGENDDTPSPVDKITPSPVDKSHPVRGFGLMGSGHPVRGFGLMGSASVDAARMEPMKPHVAHDLPGILSIPSRRQRPISTHGLQAERQHTMSLPDMHEKWIKTNSHFTSRAAIAPLTRTRPTTTTPAATTPTTTTIATTTPIPTILPHLPRLPAIVVKPAKCDLMLCVSQDNNCINASKVLLLEDRRAGVTVYGEARQNSPVTCMDNLYKITIQTRRKDIEITPTLIKYGLKRIDIKGKESIRLPYKKFLRFDFFFNRNGPQETISIKFFIKDYLKTAKGLYSEYMKNYNCEIQPTGEVTLSHMNRKFKKVTFTSPEVGFDHCYM